MATPPHLAGERAEGRAGVTILVFSQPKTTKMATPPRLVGERAEGRAEVTILAFSQPKTTKIATPASGSRYFGGFGL